MKQDNQARQGGRTRVKSSSPGQTPAAGAHGAGAEPRLRRLANGDQKDTLTGEVIEAPCYKTFDEFPG